MAQAKNEAAMIKVLEPAEYKLLAKLLGKLLRGLEVSIGN